MPEYEDLPADLPLSDLLDAIEQMRSIISVEMPGDERRQLCENYNKQLGPYALKLGLYLLLAREAFKKFPGELLHKNHPHRKDTEKGEATTPRPE